MRSRLVVGFVLLAIAVACGKNNPMNPGGGGGGGGGGVQLPNGSMSAAINGSTWNATSIQVNYSVGPPRILAIGGSNAAGTGISFAFIPNGPGTYANATSVGMNFIVTELSLQIFQSSASIVGTSGTIVLASLTANRAVGTFQCVATATPVTGSSGSRTITSGTFDVTF